MKLTQHIQNKIESSTRELERIKQNARLNEIIAQVIDERPLQQYETNTNAWFCAPDRLEFNIFYVIPSIPLMIEVLEFFETRLGGEFTSSDNETGARVFHLRSLGIELQLTVSPDEQSENTTCRKVLIGERVETQTYCTPQYKLICN